ncbi:substance-P receptor-like [Actinia tenebrosa]|uniref:Substance-P receptor-like n=1 Tax=Actinia tenebrosa TaxID=6105 RepID=A0A6P8HTU0_ACTTE|nr:substance-P receptor-like [Actinia tenebrosa]
MSNTNSSLQPNSTFNSSFPHQQFTPPWILNIPDSYRISFILSYTLILVLSVVGNTSIIAIVARNLSMRSTINYLIANMAATDLAASVVVTARLFSVMHNLSKAWAAHGVFGNMMCKLCPYIRDVSIAVSIQSMAAIAFDRFFAVVFPMRPTPRILGIRVLLPAIWFIALGYFSVELVTYKLISIYGVEFCYFIWPSGVDGRKADNIFYFTTVTFLFLLPLLVVSFVYAVIALKIRRQVVPGEQSSSSETRRRKRNKNVIKMAVSIVFCFFVCWFPYHVFNFLLGFVWNGNVPQVIRRHFGLIYDIIILVSYVSLIINPYICFVFSSNYRKSLRNLFPFSLFFATRIGSLDDTSQRSATNRVQQTEMYFISQ